MNKKNIEYEHIVHDINKNKYFKRLDCYVHHRTTRLDHSKRVSYFSYKICKFFNLDYISAARGGLLHDFFYNTYNEEKKTKLIKDHPFFAVYNSKKHFNLNKKEENIIVSHMFPLNIKVVPKYKESIIVSMVDKGVCVYEKIEGIRVKSAFDLGKAFIYVLLILKR